MYGERLLALPGPPGSAAGRLAEGLAGSLIWTSEPEPVPSPTDQAVLPDGCMDLIWLNEQLVVAGPDTEPWFGAVAGFDEDTGAAAGCQLITGVRFASGVAPSILGVPAAELRNRRVPLAELWRRTEVCRWEDRARRLGAAPVLTELSARKLGENEPDRRIRQVALGCARARPVPEIVAATGWSERTLHRHCLTSFGYGAKTLTRVLRFRRATALIGAGVPLADAAARCGYADQPHLSREVREFAGRSPATFAP